MFGNVLINFCKKCTIRVTPTKAYEMRCAKACNFTKGNTPSWTLLMFFILNKWYEVAPRDIKKVTQSCS